MSQSEDDQKPPLDFIKTNDKCPACNRLIRTDGNVVGGCGYESVPIPEMRPPGCHYVKNVSG